MTHPSDFMFQFISINILMLSLTNFVHHWLTSFNYSTFWLVVILLSASATRKTLTCTKTSGFERCLVIGADLLSIGHIDTVVDSKLSPPERQMC